MNSHLSHARYIIVCLVALSSILLLEASLFAQQPAEVPAEKMNTYPYRFNGLILTNRNRVGADPDLRRGSGVAAIHPKIILSAAHVAVDGAREATSVLGFQSYADYPYASQISWYPSFHGEESQTPPAFVDGDDISLRESTSVPIRGYTMGEDYSAWAYKEYLLGKAPIPPSAKAQWEAAFIESTNRDIVAYWGYQTMSGDYAGDNQNEYPGDGPGLTVTKASMSLKSAATEKLYTGYPANPLDVDEKQWALFETGPFSSAFVPQKSSLLKLSDSLAPVSAPSHWVYGGNSGGPVWVRGHGGAWKLAGIVTVSNGLTIPLDAPYAAKAIKTAKAKLQIKEAAPIYTVRKITVPWSADYFLGSSTRPEFWDRFQIKVPADGTYLIETTAVGAAASIDTVGTLSGTNIPKIYGSPSISNDDGGISGNFQFRVKLLKGDYTLQVRGAYPTLVGGYHLNVSSISGEGTQRIQIIGDKKASPIPYGIRPSNATVALGTDFGTLTAKAPTKEMTYLVRNKGGGVLTLIGTPRVALSGPNADQFQVTRQPDDGITTASFVIRYQPSILGRHSAFVRIESDDPEYPSFRFIIRGTAPNTFATPQGDIPHLASATTETSGWDAQETTVDSSLDYGGDIDMFRFVLAQRRQCTFWTSGSTDTFGTLYSLVGTRQTKLISADAGGEGQNFSLTRVLDPGTYIVEVKGVNADEVGAYTLHATQSPVSGHTVVTNAKGIPIHDGSTMIDPTLATDFGTVDYRKGVVDQTYTITNLGFADIRLTGSVRVTLAGNNGSAFIIKTQPTLGTLKPGAKTTFVVRYDPSYEGTFDSIVTIPTEGSEMTDAGLYVFSIQGRAMGRVQPLQKSRRLATNNRSSFFFGSQGEVKTWGEVITMFGMEYYDTPTNGIFNLTSTPTSAAGGFNRFQLTMPNGNVMGWGSYSEVSLGYGEYLGDDLWEESPQEATRTWGADEAVQVAVGATHTVVVTGSGGVWSWGDQRYGQLGNGAVVPYKPDTSHIKTTPQSITSKFGSAKIIQTSAGAFHTLALDSDGNVWAWGYGGGGQLGLGTLTNKSAPTKIPATSFGNKRIVSVACAFDSSYAVAESGVVWAWGFNGRGALGDGTLTRRTTPVMVLEAFSGLAHPFGHSPIRQITAGSDQVFVLTENGSVWTWGAAVQVEVAMNDPWGASEEELNSWTAVSPAPFQLVDGTTDPAGPIVEMAASGQQSNHSTETGSIVLSLSHALFMREDGSVWAYGANNAAQLGDGTLTSRTVPVPIIATPTSATAGSLDPDFDPSAGDSMTSGILAASARPDGRIIVGGAFTTLGGEARSHIACLEENGLLHSDFSSQVSSSVFCSALQKSGSLIIGGNFNFIGGAPRNQIAMIHPNGMLDSSFNPSADGIVYCITPQADGKILMSGLFNTVSSTTRPYIARLNADGSLDSGFNPNANAAVRCIAVQTDGKIVIGGAFTTIGGVSRPGIARLNMDGSLDSSFSSMTAVTDSFTGVTSLAIQADHKLLLAGDFRTVNGQTRHKIARLHADGTLDEEYNPTVTGYIVFSIALQADGKQVILGDFTAVGGTPRSSIARIHTDGTLDEGFDLTANRPVLSGMLQANGKIVLGGDFTTLGGEQRHFIARLLNGEATQALTVHGAGRVQWLRQGSAPETTQVTFELSTNGGSTWVHLGQGQRIQGGWELTGLNLPTTGKIRARAITRGGYNNGSAGLVEAVTSYFQ